MSTPTTPNTELEDFMIAMDGLGIIVLPAQAEKVLAWHKDQITQAERRAELKGELLSFQKIRSIKDLWESPDMKSVWLDQEISRLKAELRTLQENQANE